MKANPVIDSKVSVLGDLFELEGRSFETVRSRIIDVWFTETKEELGWGDCACELLVEMDDIDYLVRKTENPAWDFRCNHCGLKNKVKSLSERHLMQEPDARTMLGFFGRCLSGFESDRDLLIDDYILKYGEQYKGQ